MLALMHSRINDDLHFYCSLFIIQLFVVLSCHFRSTGQCVLAKPQSKWINQSYDSSSRCCYIQNKHWSYTLCCTINGKWPDIYVTWSVDSNMTSHLVCNSNTDRYNCNVTEYIRVEHVYVYIERYYDYNSSPGAIYIGITILNWLLRPPNWWKLTSHTSCHGTSKRYLLRVVASFQNDFFMTLMVSYDS